MIRPELRGSLEARKHHIAKASFEAARAKSKLRGIVAIKEMIMTSRLPVALAAVALISTAVVSTFAAEAPQDAVPWHRFTPSPEDRAAFQNARIAALHAGLALTADQDKLWPPVESALRDLGTLVADQHEKFHDAKKPLDPVARLQMRSDNMIARGQALKKLADAEAPLYAALTDVQKRRVQVLTAEIFHVPFGPRHFAMMEGPHGPGPEGGPMDHQDEGPGPDGPDHE